MWRGVGWGGSINLEFKMIRARKLLLNCLICWLSTVRSSKSRFAMFGIYYVSMRNFWAKGHCHGDDL